MSRMAVCRLTQARFGSVCAQGGCAQSNVTRHGPSACGPGPANPTAFVIPTAGTTVPTTSSAVYSPSTHPSLDAGRSRNNGGWPGSFVQVFRVGEKTSRRHTREGGYPGAVWGRGRRLRNQRAGLAQPRDSVAALANQSRDQSTEDGVAHRAKLREARTLERKQGPGKVVQSSD